MSEKIFELDPVSRVTYSELLKNFALSDNGRDFAMVDECSRVMINGNTATKLRTEVDLSGSDICVTGMQYSADPQRVLFSANDKTFVADFRRRTIREVTTGAGAAGTSIVRLSSDTYATISSSRDEMTGGIEIAVWSLGTLKVSDAITSALPRYVRCAAFFAEQSVVLMGCTKGAVLAWCLRTNRIEQIAEVEGSINTIVACPDSGRAILGQIHGLVSQVLVAEREVKDIASLRGVIQGMSRYDQDRFLVVTTTDAIGIDMSRGVFSFWNAFDSPRVESVQFSNDLKYVAVERHRDLESYRVSDMFDSFVF
ncbi:hypothetical protein ETAA8_13070 [Anatilimnocola aggregata]|uniref:Uncharacterized protein n=1 Tax=Anatilimnocola aggregata TaxID=2528021 RepID=A0A517Y7M4_9BACT|nr:WD40 repeat domain-containing protein [Anatilimnocola aggregata]QDU26231.1 hypothetical protein ETAA8_13070 [Anatilimnocola aggregata]